MELSDFRIRTAVTEDSAHIAEAIIEAVGRDITLEFAGSPERVALVKRLFTELAECPDSQYSYLNTLVAVTPEGDVAGVIIGYDGAALHGLRRRFIEKANEILGLEISEREMADETSPDEFYLDSLCVFPAYRGRGLGRRLIREITARRSIIGKPFGLLVDKENTRARRLYESLGFRPDGERPFAGTMMDHLTLQR